MSQRTEIAPVRIRIQDTEENPYLGFFKTRLEARREEAWLFHDAQPDEPGWRRMMDLVRQDAFAPLDRPSGRGLGEPSIGVLLKSIGTAVAYFAQSRLLVAFDARVGHVEQEIRAERTRVDELYRMLSGRRPELSPVNAAEIRAVVPTVLDVFEHLFGVTAIVVMTAPDQLDEPFHLLLDASRGESSIVAQARLAGAREKFYEALINLLPGPVLDAIEFDFSFPTT